MQQSSICSKHWHSHDSAVMQKWKPHFNQQRNPDWVFRENLVKVKICEAKAGGIKHHFFPFDVGGAMTHLRSTSAAAAWLQKHTSSRKSPSLKLLVSVFRPKMEKALFPAVGGWTSLSGKLLSWKSEVIPLSLILYSSQRKYTPSVWLWCWK